MGNLRVSPDDSKLKLFLRGLSLENFKESFDNFHQIDPIPVFSSHTNIEYEEIILGHYFPNQRTTEKLMTSYANSVGHNKPYYDYYSKKIIDEVVYLDDDVNFKFILNTEGYETKRRYDILLSRKGRSPIDKKLQHSDGERYGLWACKGGIPIEKVDDWIEGGRGVGTYTYMRGFIDCDNFDLTANRGSIRNTNIEILDKVKAKVNEILKDKKIQQELKERTEIEEFEKTLRSIDEDEIELKKRFSESKKRKKIVLPNGKILIEPTKAKSGYSESETLILLIQLIAYYPNLFTFKILDYNTTKGVDFVIEKSANPKYIELKGTLHKKINHSFRHISKFICYELGIKVDDIISDIEGLEVNLELNSDDTFDSFNADYKGIKYRSYKFNPRSVVIESMEIIELKYLLQKIIGAEFE